MAPTIAAAQVAFAPGPLLGQQPVSPTAADSQVSTPSNGRVQPTKLFIGGISRRTTTKQLRDHFSLGGRVLDCVAMRTPDGRPRGFGYVTLDSPAAAARFLAEPQMIDDRIVDMKLAVPEDHASKATASRPVLGTMPSFIQKGAMSMPMQDFYPGASAFYPWTDDSTFYCASGFNGLAMGHMDWQQPAVADASGESTAPANAASALPDCVDLLTGQLENWEPDSQTEGFINTGAKSPLAEVTNVFTKLSTLDKKTPAFVPQDQKDAQGLQPSRVPINTSGTMEHSFFVFEDGQANDGDDDEASTDLGAVSPDASDLSPAAPSIAPADVQEAEAANGVLQKDLPSIGSAGHHIGECRRCNFFAKGRCQNGYSCEFCHLPHERQKLTRQEKRDQRAARQADNLKTGDSSDAEAATPPQVPTPTGSIMRGPPGLSLPEPLLAVPPQALIGSAVGFHMPDSFMRMDATRSSHLSTYPSAPSACLLSTNPLPVPCTPMAFAKPSTKVMCTTGTQTDDDFTCPHCAECGADFGGESSICEGCR